MTATLPAGFPEALIDSKTLTQAYMEGKLTPQLIRGDANAMEAMSNGDISKTFMNSILGLPFYAAHTAPTEESSPIAFDRHFNPSLKYDSEYYKNVHAMIACVEKNADKATTVEQQRKACGKEFKKMRLAAFSNELMYHQVNKRFYMDLIMNKNNISPY